MDRSAWTLTARTSPLHTFPLLLNYMASRARGHWHRSNVIVIVVLVHGVMTLSFGLPVFWIFPVPRPFAQDRHIVLRVRHNSKQRWASVEMPVQEVVDRDLT